LLQPCSEQLSTFDEEIFKALEVPHCRVGGRRRRATEKAVLHFVLALKDNVSDLRQDQLNSDFLKGNPGLPIFVAEIILAR
jgi:hypothetical protein